MPFEPGFDPAEAEALIAIIAALEGPTPPLAVPTIPSGWKLELDSPVIGITDQKWQLWKNDDLAGRYAVVIRGTVKKTGSILEDALSVMIPAAGKLEVEGRKLPYRLAESPQAAVHLGFAIGLMILLFDPKGGMVTELSDRGGDVRELFIAGHSQGAAIATLLRSYLEYSDVLHLAAAYKTYVYAQPKPGNDHYAHDFESIAANRGMAFRIANSQDWVPQSPLTFELPRDLDRPNVLDPRGRHSVLGEVEEKLRELEQRIGQAHSSALSPHLSRLARRIDAHPRLQSIVERVGTATHVRIEPTLHFVGAGEEISLIGTPGTNPERRDDFFWQHHAAQYFDLLRKTFVS